MTHAWGRQPVGARLKDVGSGAEDESVGKFGAHSKDETSTNPLPTAC